MFKNKQDPVTQGYLLLADFRSCINNKCTEQDREKWAGPAQSTEDLVSDPKSASWLPAQQRVHHKHQLLSLWLFIQSGQISIL